MTALDRAQNAAEVTRTPIGLEWPQGIFSLSHVGLPFPLDDPHYGAKPPAVAEGIYLGRPRLLGELGFLALPERNLMRLRFNPFYSYMEKEILQFMSMAPGNSGAATVMRYACARHHRCAVSRSSSTKRSNASISASRG